MENYNCISYSEHGVGNRRAALGAKQILIRPRSGIKNNGVFFVNNSSNYAKPLFFNI